MQKGSKHTEEAKDKIRRKLKGRAGTFTGRQHSADTKAKQAAGMRAYWAERKGEQQ